MLIWRRTCSPFFCPSFITFAVLKKVYYIFPTRGFSLSASLGHSRWVCLQSQLCGRLRREGHLSAGTLDTETLWNLWAWLHRMLNILPIPADRSVFPFQYAELAVEQAGRNRAAEDKELWWMYCWEQDLRQNMHSN